MFAYCLNNPVNGFDPSGHAFHTLDSKLIGIGSFYGIVDAGGGGGISGCGGESGRRKSLKVIQREIAYYNNTSEQVVLESEFISFYHGIPVLRIDGNRSGFFGVIFLTRETNSRLNPEDVIRHEYGHSIQFKQLGLINYALSIGIPSWQNWGSGSYYSKPWEITADIYGGVQSRNHSQSKIDAGFAYLEASKAIGPFVWFSIE